MNVINNNRRTEKNCSILFKDSIVGGPSIIFNRYNETGTIHIHNRNGIKLCAKIIGFDENALYLWALSQLMLVGQHEYITNII